jgi:hypothetical protein
VGVSGVTWKALRPREREYLMLSCSQGINPKNRLMDKAVLGSLEVHGLIQEATNKKGRLLWRPTVLGLEVIASRGMRPTFLHQRSQYGYTHVLRNAMPREPEVMR